MAAQQEGPGLKKQDSSALLLLPEKKGVKKGVKLASGFVSVAFHVVLPLVSIF